jgi:FtsZ-interacting cell division protein ZipA
MKKINLIAIAVLIFLLISCTGSAKKKGEDAKKANEPAKTTEAAKKTEDVSADKKSAAEDTAVAVDDNKETPNTETAQAETDKEKLADEPPSLETESTAQEVAAVTPPEPPQPPPAQLQPPAQTPQPPAQAQPQQPPRQTQPQTPPAQTQPQTPPAQEQTQPPAAEKTAADTASSDSDSQTKKDLPPPTEGPSPPALRIDSLVQMGTMPHDNEIAFSRIVHATVGQIVEIPFRGTGWIYMGEIASQRGIVFNTRRNDTDGQTIIFSLEEPGTYVLKFYRRDIIRDYILNDYVQVIAEDAPKAVTGWLPTDRGKVVAQPRWPSVIEETQIITGTKPPTEPVVTKGTTEPPAKTTTPPPAATAPASQQRPTTETTASQRTAPTPSTNTTPAPSSNITSPVSPSSAASTAQIPSIPAIAPSETPSSERKETLSPEKVMQKAKENYDGGKIPEAIALLDQFILDYPGGSDELYWLLGQYYEANSPSRNILLSLDYYRRLVNEYPQSNRFNDARRRIAYLERYYINIQ